MSVQDKNISKTAYVARECLTLELGASATSQAALQRDSVVPGFPFEIVKVEAYLKAITAVGTVDIQIGSTSALAAAITPVADTPTAGTLATALSARRGSATAAINLKYTTDGSGVLTHCRVRVWVRPVPLNGEA